MTPPRPDRVIVLAAGMGLRLGALTPDRPKALVEVAGHALVEHALRFAAWFDPRETVVVTGFHRDLVEAHLDSLAMPRVRLVDNPACAGGNLRSVDAFDGGYAGLTFVADAACARVRRASTQSAGPKSTRRRISGAPGRASVRRTRPAAARRTAGNGESDRRHRPLPPMTDLAAPDHRGPAVAGRPHHVGHLAPWCGIMGCRCCSRMSRGCSARRAAIPCSTSPRPTACGCLRASSPSRARATHRLLLGPVQPADAARDARRRRQRAAPFRALAGGFGLADAGVRRTLLYAPTWDDAIGSSSLFATFEAFVARMPADRRLIAKLHPHAERHAPMPDRIEAACRGRGAHLARNSPPTCPLLDLADAYGGDMPSLACDFLSSGRPMFFTNPTSGTASDAKDSRLFACGTVIPPDRYDRFRNIVDEAWDVEAERQGEARAALDAHTHAPARAVDGLRAGKSSACAGPAPAWMTDEALAPSGA